MSDQIDYQKKLDGALRQVVRDVLDEVASEGLPGEHHFFLTFDTQEPGVSMSDWLRQQYPEEMTVVLQHQFWNLVSNDEGFGVTLRFSGAEERVEVPWQALTVFADPSVEFGLQLGSTLQEPEQENEPVEAVPSACEATAGSRAEVVQIDDFRRS